MTTSTLHYRDRTTGSLRQEKVYGDSGIRWLYETKPGYLLERTLLCRKPLSRIYGLYNDSAWSAKRISDFVKDYEIDLSQFEVPEGGYKSFNEFFYRRYKSGLRPFPVNTKHLGAPAEGRYFAFENISHDRFFPIKGQSLSLAKMLGDNSLARRYEGGVGLVARLCPVDYHRYHFPDSGRPSLSKVISGVLHSVNPKALKCRPQIFQENERVLTLFDSDHFGTIAYIEVGALCVGRMVQTYQPNQLVKRGDEKGYFSFGASTVVLFLEKGRVTVDADLLASTQQGVETYLKVGEKWGECS